MTQPTETLIPSLEISLHAGRSNRSVHRSLLVQEDAQKIHGFSNACALLHPEHKGNVCNLNQFQVLKCSLFIFMAVSCSKGQK